MGGPTVAADLPVLAEAPHQWRRPPVVPLGHAEQWTGDLCRSTVTGLPNVAPAIHTQHHLVPLSSDQRNL